MPRFVGHDSSDLDAQRVGRDDVPHEFMLLNYAQARYLKRAIPSARILAVLNENDRGGAGRKAKRWFNWYANAHDVLRIAKTRAMRERADSHIRGEGRRVLSDEAEFHGRLEREFRDQDRMRMVLSARSRRLTELGVLDSIGLVSQRVRACFPNRTPYEWASYSDEFIQAELARCLRD